MLTLVVYAHGLQTHAFFSAKPVSTNWFLRISGRIHKCLVACEWQRPWTYTYAADAYVQRKGHEFESARLLNFYHIPNQLFWLEKLYKSIDCAFHYWAEQNSKVLAQPAWIVFAVTMTQVSVERLFSGVKFILCGLRNSLAEDTLQATMLQRTNVWAYQFSVRIQHSPIEFFSVQNAFLLKLFLYNVPL